MSVLVVRPYIWRIGIGDIHLMMLIMLRIDVQAQGDDAVAVEAVDQRVGIGTCVVEEARLVLFAQAESE